MFANGMNWTDNLLMETTDLRRCHLPLGMYAIHLATGNTLFCCQIKAASIKNYVRDIASFAALHRKLDIRRENATYAKLSPIITSVFDELKRWEDIPNRREPSTLEMLEAAYALVSSTNAHPNSLMAALANWFECALFSGLRLTEYSQPGNNSDPSYPVQNYSLETRGFCIGDICFATADHTRLSAIQATTHSSSKIAKCWIKFRTQKSGLNGEERLYTANPRTNGKCFVRSMLLILSCFLRIRGPHDSATPLALYQESNMSSPKLISSINIEALMRHVAATVYGLCPVKDKKELQRWLAHSLRVGACVILHSMGFTDTQIKWLLRWRSDAFMVYLKNLAILANRQHTTFDEAVAMPHFL
jgi:hypothetical protein